MKKKWKEDFLSTNMVRKTKFPTEKETRTEIRSRFFFLIVRLLPAHMMPCSCSASGQT